MQSFCHPFPCHEQRGRRLKLACVGHGAQIEPSGKRFLLEEEKVRVKVEDGKIQRMEVLPSKGAGPLALYKALGGTVPAKQGAAA